ncbi:dynein regulatory complex protein 1-like [Dendronephthya gigantea]|uniref:dynein regulatory complex protein 1-like n=1 Tax=Dendronephthya gigantea TaxID=151771 RepID=UPI00106BB760|nr:dynein regulatory complex protein 1-like [Dendronephthya gigantea]
MSAQGDDGEDTGPSVDSTEPEERIAARRLRIQRRIEAAKREANGEEAISKKPIDSEKDSCKSRKQIEESRQRLLKLKSDGTELVTNIQVAGDARENVRRVEDDENRRQRIEKLEAELKAAVEKFDEITKKWSQALSKEIPQDLQTMLLDQKSSCDVMIDEKNKLINDFQQELKGLDDRYVKDLKKQAEDVDLMIERMDEQIKNLTKAYREELLQIEKSFVSERTELIENNRKKWQNLMQQRRDREVEFLQTRRKRVEEYEEQLDTLRVQDAEEYNMVKIKLETDVQILEQQLQQMKATYQLNQEKLEYNFQVLKKRDEENTITKSQQKRKITRLQDSLNNLKAKLAKQEKTYRDDNQSLTDDYERITEQYRELQKKFRHFQATDAKKFLEMWLMNEAQAKELINDVLEEDRIIHEQQLGLPWSKPQLDFLESKGPIMITNAEEKKLSATQVAQKALATDISEEDQDKSTSTVHDKRSVDKSKLSLTTIKTILELLSDEAGFLVEEKLNRLLAPLEKDEQSLMRLDAIFSALGVENEDDIYNLARYFFASQHDKDGSIEEETGGVKNEQTEDDGIKKDDSKAKSLASTKDVPDLIHPNEVVKKLRNFVEENRQIMKESRKASFKKPGENAGRNASLDAEYWQKMTTVIGSSEEHVWDALTEGFEKYLSVLTERAALIQETGALEQQNSELRMLLHQYINSKVNQELEVPPTHLMKFDVSKD